ncbi:MAG: hypothetical protein M1834_004005 [Cirrosporium novae-zelandiae]|nr:MAG: hypothetical protein M1834_004005 [Cirrosporium novae-zelandiae]
MSTEPSTTLFDLLSTTLILYQLVPYLPISSLISLAASSKRFQALIWHTPGVFRYLDLSTLKGADVPFTPIDTGGEVWNSQRLDEAVTEDDFYGGPLRGIFAKLTKKKVLHDVRTLILDGLSVPAELVYEILTEECYNIRILSIREVKNLNVRKLMGTLRHCVRPSRPEGTPRLKALYVFGKIDAGLSSPTNSLTGDCHRSPASNDADPRQKLDSSLKDTTDCWYRRSGKIFQRPLLSEWAETVDACKDIISFDAILCPGSRHCPYPYGTPEPLGSVHHVDRDSYLPPALATVAIGPEGCGVCGKLAEQPAIFGKSPSSCLPLLSPPPLHGITVKAAQHPSTAINPRTPVIARCQACLMHRYCENCGHWYCEECIDSSEKSRINHQHDMAGDEIRSISPIRIRRVCFECGFLVSYLNQRYA